MGESPPLDRWLRSELLSDRRDWDGEPSDGVLMYFCWFLLLPPGDCRVGGGGGSGMAWGVPRRRNLKKNRLSCRLARLCTDVIESGKEENAASDSSSVLKAPGGKQSSTT